MSKTIKIRGNKSPIVLWRLEMSGGQVEVDKNGKTLFVFQDEDSLDKFIGLKKFYPQISAIA